MKVKKVNQNLQSRPDEVSALYEALHTSDGLDPSAQFVEQLAARMLTEEQKLNSSSRFISYISSFMENLFKLPANKQLTIVGSIAAVLVISGVIGYAYLQSSNNLKLSPADQQQLLDRIAAANQTSNLRDLAAPTAAENAAAAGGDTSKLATPESLLLYREGFYKSKTTTKYGPKATFCGSNYRAYPIDEFTSEWSNLASPDGYYAKSITSDTQGNIIDYSLTTPEYTYQYKGGQYAVKLTGGWGQAWPLAARSAELDSTAGTGGGAAESTGTTEADSATSTISRDAGTADDIVGIDADQSQKIVGEETLNGVRYYIVESTYDYYCNGNDNQKVVSRAWAEKDSYVYAIQEDYLNSVNADNLISRFTYDEEQKQTDQINIAVEFALDYTNLTVKEIDTLEYVPGSEKYNQALVNYITANSLVVLQPQGGQFRAELIVSDKLNLPSSDSYMLDRQFYRADAVGEAEYKQTSEVYSYKVDESEWPDLTYAFSTANENTDIYTYINVSAYRQPLSEVVNRHVYDGAAKPEDVQVKVNGENVAAKLYRNSEVGRTEPGSPEAGAKQGESALSVDPVAPVTLPAPDDQENDVAEPAPIVSEYHDWVAIFTYNNVSYVVNLSFSGKAETGLEKLQFSLVTNVSDFVKKANPEPQNPVIAY